MWHGTHVGGARKVLEDGGFKESNDPTKHEFSLPGVYATTDARETLEPYAVSTLFTDKYHFDTPFVKPIFLVQAKHGDCLRRRGTEVVYRAGQLNIVELHLLRG